MGQGVRGEQRPGGFGRLAPYREAEQVRKLRIIGASFLVVGEGRCRYEVGMARRNSGGLDWNRSCQYRVRGFHYQLVSSQVCSYSYVFMHVLALFVKKV